MSLWYLMARDCGRSRAALRGTAAENRRGATPSSPICVSSSARHGHLHIALHGIPFCLSAGAPLSGTTGAHGTILGLWISVAVVVLALLGCARCNRANRSCAKCRASKTGSGTPASAVAAITPTRTPATAVAPTGTPAAAPTGTPAAAPAWAAPSDPTPAWAAPSDPTPAWAAPSAPAPPWAAPSAPTPSRSGGRGCNASGNGCGN
jgi:hypothetical protein